MSKKTKSDTSKKDQEQKELSLKKRAMIDALEKTLGVVQTAAKSIGIHRSTHYAWMQEDAEYKKQVEDMENVALDFAESQLHQQIKDGNASSTIFYLKTKGKKRGYVERLDLNNLNPTEPIEVHIIDPASDQDDEDQSK